MTSYGIAIHFKADDYSSAVVLYLMRLAKMRTNGVIGFIGDGVLIFASLNKDTSSVDLTADFAPIHEKVQKVAVTKLIRLSESKWKSIIHYKRAAENPTLSSGFLDFVLKQQSGQIVVPNIADEDAMPFLRITMQ